MVIMVIFERFLPLLPSLRELRMVIMVIFERLLPVLPSLRIENGYHGYL